MAGITTAFCTSAKGEFFSGAFCFNATITPTGDTTSGLFTVSSMSSNAGIVVGMFVSGTGIPANTKVASIDSASQITLSKAATASNTSTVLTVSGDVFRIALFKNSVAGTFGAGTVNYSDMGADEASGTGYTATGVQLGNVTATTSGTTGYTTFSPNPSWTSSSFSTDGALIYDETARMGGTSGTNTTGGGRALGVFSFGGTQTVTAGSLSIIIPPAAAGTAIFRLG